MRNIDYELLDMFKRQYYKQLVTIKDLIDLLHSMDTYEEAINGLFRVFHNYKSSTSYVGIDTIKELVVVVENMLETIRVDKGPVHKEIAQWLYRVEEQLQVWQIEMQEDTIVSLSQTPKELLKKVRLTRACDNFKEKLKTLSIVYLDSSLQRSQKMLIALKKIAIDVEFALTIPKEKSSCDICIISKEIGILFSIEDIHSQFPNAAILVIVDKMTDHLQSKLMFQGISHFLSYPIRFNDLKRELENMTRSHFSGKRVLIDNEKIYKFIQMLQPLPNSIFKIQAICNDEESSIKELLQVIKKDPIITTNILHAARSPIYGLKHISTIDQAVSIFGKKTISAIVFFGLSKNISSLDLDTYGINENTFSQVATLRLKLMVKWYSKVSIASLSVLSISSVLGNLGQLLLASEIKNSHHIEEFKEEALRNGYQTAEEKFVHTNTTSVTSDILKYYKLDHEISDSILYSDNPSEAPVDIHHLCIANHIVFNIILLDGTINAKIPQKILNLMQEENLDPEPLLKAIKYIETSIQSLR